MASNPRSRRNATPALVEAGFTVIVTANTGGTDDKPRYHAGDKLTLKRDVIEYLRLAMNQGKDEGNETTLTDDQIFDAVKGVNVENLEPRDAEGKYLDTLEALEQVNEGPSLSIGASGQRHQSSIWAQRCGEMVSAGTVDLLEKGDEAKRTSDGTPLAVAYSLLKDFDGKKTDDGELVIDTWPVVNTRKRVGSDKNNVPEGYNQVTDMGKIKDGSGSGFITWNWTRDFCYAMPHIRDMALHREYLISVKNEKDIDAVKLGMNPALKNKLKDEMTPEEREIDLAECTKSLTAYLRNTKGALQFVQTKRRIERHFNNVAVQLGKPDPVPVELASRQAKPVYLVCDRDSKPDPETGKIKTYQDFFGPLTVARFIGIGRFIHHETPSRVERAIGVNNTNGHAAARFLTDVEPRKKREEPAAGSQTSGVGVPTINDATAFVATAAQAWSYLETHQDWPSLVKAACLRPNGGAESAYYLCLTVDSLKELTDQQVIRDLAAAHQLTIQTGRSEAAKMEAAKLAAQAAANSKTTAALVEAGKVLAKTGT